MQSYDLELLAQSNAVLTSSKSAVMAQLAQMNVIMNAMPAQIKTFSLTTMNPTSTKSNFYCWSCGRNFTHGSKACLAKKMGHKEDANYKKLVGGSNTVV